MQNIKKYITTLLLLAAVLTTDADTPIGRQGCRHVSQTGLTRSQRASASNSLLTGERHQLILLASFSDLKFKSESPLELWTRIFNEEHFREEPFYGSIHDYFYDQSYGKFDLRFDLHLVELDKPSATYCSVGVDDSRTGLLLYDMLDIMKDAVEDWSIYDWDEDGMIDQVFILYAGLGQNDGGGSNTIWPHQWTLSEQGEEPFQREWGKPYPVTSGGSDYLVDAYACSPELSKAKDYGSFGTLCHEYGHCLGLPDFYYGSNTAVVYTWDIMDYGNYNKGGFCPPGYSAHERMVLGWLDVRELTEPTDISNMGTVNNGKEAYLIRNDGYPKEYYIIENRQKEGWDQSLPGSGLVVFHIDYDEEIWQKGVPNSSEYKRYSIIPANGLTSTSNAGKWAYPYSNGPVTIDRLTNTSIPPATLYHANSDGTMLMNKSITKMTISDGLASFRFMADASDIVTVTTGRSEGETLYRIGDINIIRYANGSVKKVRKQW